MGLLGPVPNDFRNFSNRISISTALVKTSNTRNTGNKAYFIGITLGRVFKCDASHQ